MKITDKKKPVNTIPEGVWESGRDKQPKKKNASNPATDLQGNGYPSDKKSKQFMLTML